MDGRQTRGRIYRQRIIEVLANYWELTPNQRSSVVDSLSNHIIHRGRHHMAIREWEVEDYVIIYLSSEKC